MSALLIRALWSLVFIGVPGVARAIDLLQAYRDALGHDATYIAAKGSRDAGLEKLAQGRAGLLPNVTVSANTAWNDLNNASGGFQRKYNSNGYTLQLSQPVFNKPAWDTFKQGQLLAAQSEAQFLADSADLMVRVAQAYFDVVAAQEVLDAQQALKTASQEQLDRAQGSLQIGTVAITDVDEARARLDLASAQVFAAQNDLEVKRHALGEIIGQDPDAVPGLRKDVALARPQPEDMGQWVASAQDGSPTVQVRRLGFESATRELERNRAAYLPTLDLLASRQDSNTVNTLAGTPFETRQGTVMLQLNVPIFSGGRLTSREREAAGLMEKARGEWLDARRIAAQAARQNYLGVMNGLSQSRALESAVASSLSSLEGNLAGYEIGTRDNIDVLNAQSQVADGRQRLAKARVDTIMAQLKLKAATGQLTADDLAEVSALLDR